MAYCVTPGHKKPLPIGCYFGILVAFVTYATSQKYRNIFNFKAIKNGNYIA